MVVAVIEQITVEQCCGFTDLSVGVKHGSFFQFRWQTAHRFLYLDAGSAVSHRLLSTHVGRARAECIIPLLEEGKEISGFFFAEERKHETSI